MSLEDVDLFIPHQANLRIIDAAVEGLGIDRDKVFVNLDRYGNTSAASIPISIAEAVRQGRIQDRHKRLDGRIRRWSYLGLLPVSLVVRFAKPSKRIE